MPGQALGIIGMNGAGKSTLLKIITGTTMPTHGSVEMTGRVAALLELGMGFHPDFTGRQNAYMAGQLLGLSIEKISELMPEIEAFAEIGEYIDQPIRMYSSGMQVRLAFSVATAHRPDILIIDEALSVGDAYFQHKSFERIRQYKDLGTTLLLVSHDKTAVQTICDTAVLLNEGKIEKSGDPEEVFDYYNALIAKKDNAEVVINRLDNGKAQVSSGTGEAKVESVRLLSQTGTPIKCVGVGDAVTLEVSVKVLDPVDSLVLGYGIKDRYGNVMFGTNTWHTDQVLYNPKPGQRFIFRIGFLANFGIGSYSVQTALVDRDTHLTKNYEWQDNAFIFEMINKDKIQFVGSLWSEPNIGIERINA